MAKQGVVPDELTKPFWDAANEERLVIQNCQACNRLQHPPAPTCGQCGSGDNLEWKELSGRGKIYNYAVVYDCPVRLLQEEQPYMFVAHESAVIALNRRLRGIEIGSAGIFGYPAPVSWWLAPPATAVK